MKTLIIVLLLATAVSAQTFKDCRVDRRGYDAKSKGDATFVQCVGENGKPVTRAFPVSANAFGNQCAVTDSELANRKAQGLAWAGLKFSDPFTLKLVDGKWEAQQDFYSVCEMWLNELPTCVDQHGKPEIHTWQQKDLWHGGVPCHP